MRSAAVGMSVLIIAISTFFIIASIQVNSNIYSEISMSLNEGIYKAERVLFDNKEDIHSNDELITEFNKQLDRQLADGRDYTVKVYGVDYEKGLLDVEVSTSYRNFFGNQNEVSTRRTMIIDRATT